MSNPLKGITADYPPEGIAPSRTITIDDGEGHEWAEALLFGPWRQIAPDTFDNGASEGAELHRPAAPLLVPFIHDNSNSAEAQ